MLPHYLIYEQGTGMNKLKRKVSVIGLGYVGLPVAVEFGKHARTIAFDINSARIEELKNHFDRTNEVSAEDLQATDCLFTTNTEDLKQADFHIVAVPTPINAAKQPDLHPLLSASRTVGSILKAGDIVVYESTVYPGTTEEECVPVLEESSGLKCGVDFFVGYSPERINPGDKQHTFTKIQKIVSGQTQEILDIVAETYGAVVEAGVYKASNIKVAEAAKVIENTQRDLNIALVNELSIIFNELNISTKDVLAAAGTKWNFLPFEPGLVGGHCIGVDPYYLTHKATMHGLHPQVILAGRRTNDNMGKYIAEQTIKQMIKLHKPVNKSRIGILGLTFKNNCPDLRNSKVTDIYRELENYGAELLVHDPHASPAEARIVYGIELLEWHDLQDVDAIIIAVAHDAFKLYKTREITDKIRGKKLVIDAKSILNRDELQAEDAAVWSL